MNTIPVQELAVSAGDTASAKFSDDAPDDEEIPDTTASQPVVILQSVSRRVMEQLARRVANYTIRQEISLIHAHNPQRMPKIGIAFVSRKIMRTYNNTFRGIDSATDVLSFTHKSESSFDTDFDRVMTAASHHDVKNANEPYAGDIALCLDYIAEQARCVGERYAVEVARCAIHGVLHVLGHTHKTYKPTEPMLIRQELLLSDDAIRAHVSAAENHTRHKQNKTQQATKQKKVRKPGIGKQ